MQLMDKQAPNRTTKTLSGLGTVSEKYKSFNVHQKVMAQQVLLVFCGVCKMLEVYIPNSLKVSLVQSMKRNNGLCHTM